MTYRWFFPRLPMLENPNAKNDSKGASEIKHCRVNSCDFKHAHLPVDENEILFLLRT